MSPCCLAVCVSPPVNVLKSEPIFTKFCMYIMVSEPNSTLHFINLCHQSVCIPITAIFARQRLGKRVPVAMNTYNHRKIVGGVVFCGVRAMSN
jgi:hypothetical protein